MLIIDVKDGNIERALKSYKNKVKSVKQIEQLRNRKEFEKPSITKRIAKQKAIRKGKLQNFFDKNFDKIKEIEYMHRLRLITKKLNLSPATSDDFSTDSTFTEKSASLRFGVKSSSVKDEIALSASVL